MHTTLRQLETLQMFALTRSVTETARLTRVSQPAVSQTLKDLEAQFGFSIFSRVNGRPTLSAEAMQILPEIERILAQFTALRGRVNELRDMRAGSLSIMTGPTATFELIPRAIADFRRQRPNVRFHLDVSTASDITRKVREETIDLGLNVLPANEVSIATEPLFRTRMVCVLPLGHRLRRFQQVTPKDLVDETVVVVRQDGPLSPRVIAALGSLNDRANSISTNQSIAALNLVRQGVGIAILHPMALTQSVLREVEVTRFEPSIDVTFGLLYSRRRPMPRIMSKFFGSVRDAAVDFSTRMRPFGVEVEVLL
jgi:DNA-binding transcriptional LysR family regulator